MSKYSILLKTLKLLMGNGLRLALVGVGFGVRGALSFTRDVGLAL